MSETTPPLDDPNAPTGQPQTQTAVLERTEALPQVADAFSRAVRAGGPAPVPSSDAIANLRVDRADPRRRLTVTAGQVATGRSATISWLFQP